MDIATFLGIGGGFGVLVFAVFLEGSKLSMFMDLLATNVVIGGALTTTMARFTMGGFVAALTTGLKAVAFNHHVSARDTIEKIAELADIVRKQGPLGLEAVEIEDEFLAKGMRMIADGFDLHIIRETLERERDLHIERLDDANKLFNFMGNAAPGMGMVGTIIGLISMFAHMDDPKKIGPGMAVALLTTLYGAIMANVVALPIADKLQMKSLEENINYTLVIDGVMMIRENKSPAVIRDMLISYLPNKHRASFQEAA
ncbi:motility protein A [Pinisolibacter aquiterrae]|jgi:chemotaxis protein MotA|uniref:motility protein A n=1 Tax=Pinisolibacter aquiterrae TaxID=2815579 RepID=UPI001C3DFF5C|nr:MotA/TolQ/ExbB proton channel family protein [Pinisolibacter aquiterrae]MBV5263949.1 MotA/TolQ/ExbB proton channel family protein [Pinisolibacter aquiterrae]MCC8235960.1 MotA/TolQ/ExbB proton channel family protein [Pinisolibacter aquiterrae]